MHLTLDDAGRRLLVGTVRYPPGELRRDEAHLYELSDSGAIAHRRTLNVSDTASLTLAPDGTQLAAGCDSDACLYEWGEALAMRRLPARGRRMEIGALAFRPDLGLLVAAQRQRMELLSWELRDGAHRAWAVASAGERLRETVTPRLHGRPPWIPRWVGISPDGARVASLRDDGTVSLWRRDGQLIKSMAATAYTELEPAFTAAGGLIALRGGDERISAIDADTERVVLAVDAPPSRSYRRAQLCFGSRASYLAVSRPTGVAIHAFPSGAPVSVIPFPDEVWRIAMDGRSGVLALATQHRVTLVRLSVPDPATSR